MLLCFGLFFEPGCAALNTVGNQAKRTGTLFRVAYCETVAGFDLTTVQASATGTVTIKFFDFSNRSPIPSAAVITGTLQ